MHMITMIYVSRDGLNALQTTNRKLVVQSVYLVVCMYQIDSSRLHCCTCPYSLSFLHCSDVHSALCITQVRVPCISSKLLSAIHHHSQIKQNVDKKYG
jgi:hypothetical protein